MKKLNDLFYSFLQVAASTQKLGIHLIRISILIIFVWIGGLKFWNYEAEGIVPFVANSPFMSFFYTKSAPEYKTYKLKEGEFDQAKHEWHQENNTYGFSRGLGILIMAIGILTFLGIFSPKIGLVGAGLAIIMTFGTLSFLVTTPEVWVPESWQRGIWFPVIIGGRAIGDKRYGDTGRCDRGAVGFGATDLEKEISETRKRGMVLMPFPFFLLVTFILYDIRVCVDLALRNRECYPGIGSVDHLCVGR